MQCFKCGTTVIQRLSQYGYYYYCPNCGKIFETSGQTEYNQKHYRSLKKIGS